MYAIMVNQLREGFTMELFSLEVAEYMIWINLCSAYYCIDTKDVSAGKHNDKLEAFYEKYGGAIKIHDDKYHLDKIEKISLESKADIIYIDYVQNISSSGRGEYENMTLVAKTIQQIAIRTKIPIFDLSQVSNE